MFSQNVHNYLRKLRTTNIFAYFDPFNNFRPSVQYHLQNLILIVFLFLETFFDVCKQRKVGKGFGWKNHHWLAVGEIERTGNCWGMAPQRSLTLIGYFQMAGDAGQSNLGFQCFACESLHIELDISSLQKHFASKHGILNLLSSPATQVFFGHELFFLIISMSQAVAPPGILSSCHADSCDQSKSLYGCVFCGGTGLHENEMKEHLGRIHGGFFKQSWKSFSTSHCR